MRLTSFGYQTDFSLLKVGLLHPPSKIQPNLNHATLVTLLNLGDSLGTPVIANSTPQDDALGTALILNLTTVLVGSRKLMPDDSKFKPIARFHMKLTEDGPPQSTTAVKNNTLHQTLLVNCAYSLLVFVTLI